MQKNVFARHIGVSPSYISKLIERGRLTEASMIKVGSDTLIDSDKAEVELKRNLSGVNLGLNRKKPGKKPKRKAVEIVAPKKRGSKKKTASELFLENLGINPADLPGRSDLEACKLAIEARILARKDDEAAGKLIDAEEVKKRGFAAGRHIRDQCLAIADRCSPLVAACSDQFECKQILMKEITYILEGTSKMLEVKS